MVCTCVAALRIAALSHRQGAAKALLFHRHTVAIAARHAPVLIDHLPRRLIVVLRKAHRPRTTSVPPPTRQALDSKNSHGHTASCARRQRDARRQRAYGDPCCGAHGVYPGRVRAAARTLRGAALPAACRQPVEGARGRAAARRQAAARNRPAQNYRRYRTTT